LPSITPTASGLTSPTSAALTPNATSPVISAQDFSALGNSPIDSAVDNLLANDQPAPAVPSQTPNPCSSVPVVPTPPSNNSSVATNPGPTPYPLPTPDPSIYPPLTPSEYQSMRSARQVVKGVGEIGLACLSIASACASAESPAAPVVVPLAVTNAASDFGAGTVNIITGLTGQTAIGEQTEQNLKAYGTPVAGIVSTVTGSPQKGEAAGSVVTAVTSLGDVSLSTPQGLIAVSDVAQGVTALPTLLPSQPLNGINGAPCPQPTPPITSPNLTVPNNAPTPAPAPTPQSSSSPN
jgi:hypothetical protein